MKIVLDAHIPYLAEAVQSEWREVRIYPMEPEEITPSAVRDADVLVVRTRTGVDEALLKDSSVRLVCTATIGYDHIDTAYCDSRGIRWVSCPGCNAKAVCEYIEEAIDEYLNSQLSTIHTASADRSRPCRDKNSQLSTVNCQLSIGIIGVGHVGSLVAQMAARKGFRVLLNDPPKGIGVSLDEIAKNCDIITFHTPLILQPSTLLLSPSERGREVFPTYHLCDEAFLRCCKPGALIINAARGGVVDEQALLRSGHPYILDTWEREPHPDHEVLEHALFASMHIAGYSEEGKRNASQMCLDAIAQQFRLPPITLLPPPQKAPAAADSAWLASITAQLKAAPDRFEQLRKEYPLR